MIAYILKSSISLTAFFLCYYFFFRKDKRFLFNRFYLLSAIIFSLLVPLIVFHIPIHPVFFDDPYFLPVGQKLFPLQNGNAFTKTGVNPATSTGIPIDFVTCFLYLLGVFTLTYRYLRNIMIIKKLIAISEYEPLGQAPAKLMLVDQQTPPFSFGTYVFVNKEDYNNGKVDHDIIHHEMIHIKHYHTLDILFIEFLLICYWFNPLLWLYRLALKANHEYCADDYVISCNSGIEVYCHKLIGFTHTQHNSLLGSGFNYSLTKNRIVMMKSTKSSGFTFGKKLTITAIAVCITIAAFSFKTLDFRNTASPKKAIITDGMARQGEGDLEGWFKAGSKPSSYEIGTTKVDGNTVAFIKSVENQVDGFGTIMQNASLEDYKGKRVKLRARIKTEGVSDWCGLWFRVDGDGRQPLAFDNMQHRPIKGTTDWKEYEVVLDVSQESLALAYGVLLSNTGNVWIDDFNFEVVDKSVPVTSQSQSSSPQSKPKNLDFEN